MSAALVALPRPPSPMRAVTLSLLLHIGGAVVVAWMATQARTPPRPLPMALFEVVTLALPPEAVQAVAPSTPPAPLPPPQARDPEPAVTPPAPRPARPPVKPSPPKPRQPHPAPTEATPAPTGTTPAPTGSAETPAPTAPVEQPPQHEAAYLNNPRPAYPPFARRLGQEGTVRIRVEVDAQGGVVALTLAASSGFPLLDEAALEAVRHFRFIPAQRGNAAVAATVEVPIRFQLKEARP